MMNHKKNSERGQALIIVVFAIVGLIGIVGLAVDGGLAYSDRRHAQNVADAASYAGALARINKYADSRTDPLITPPMIEAAAINAALQRADDNGYTNDKVTNTVKVYFCNYPEATCALPGDVAKSDYIQVIIESTVNTYFAKIVNIPQVHNRVEAVALADVDTTGSLFGGHGVVTVDPYCQPSGSMVVNGTAQVVVTGGGMFSNAGPCESPKDAFVCTSNTIDLTVCDEWTSGVCTKPGTITTAGGNFDLSENCKTNMTGTTDDQGFPLEYWQGIPLLPEPSQCEVPTDPSEYPTATYKADWDNPDTAAVEAIPVTILSPGYYGTFPPKKDSLGNNLQNTIVMDPGIYCVASVVKLVDQNIFLWGRHVTLWIREGFGTNIAGSTVQLTATVDDGDTDYKDDETIYSGYLFYVAPDFTGSVTSCKFEGNGLNKYIGAIFAPHCLVQITGTEDTPPEGIDSQIIAYDLTITGNALLIINYTGENNPVVRDKATTGQFK